MILPGPVSRIAATVRVPGSKSLTNRALLAAAVAGGGVIRDPLDCDDTRVLAAALKSAGWAMEWRDTIRVGERTGSPETAKVWMGDSGTGARLMIALLAATPGRFVVDGGERLRQRPMGPLIDAMARLGARLESVGGGLPVTIHGRRLSGGHVSIRPEVSSQFVSALLLAAPLMQNGLELRVDGSLPSRPYIDLTEDTLRAIDVTVEHDEPTRTWRVEPGAARPAEMVIEGDWSAAAFFVAAAAVTEGRIEIGPLSVGSRQGDRVIQDIVRHAGVRVSESGFGIVVQGPVIRPLQADLEQAPDVFPALAAVAASGPPGSRFEGLAHLKHKESDRLTVMVDNLRTLGADFAMTESTALVRRGVGAPSLTPRPVVAAADHRIAMSMAVTALSAGPLRLDDPDCVSKSFPDFWSVWEDMLRGRESGCGG